MIKKSISSKLFKAWQAKIVEEINDYMKKNNVGFNDLVRILNISPTQLAKIQKGQANLTLISLIHIFTTLNYEPKLIFNKKRNLKIKTSKDCQ